MTPPLRAVELFAGVGGFRLALEPLGYQFVYASQWEPGKKKQHAADIYRSHYGEVDNRDIRTVHASEIPTHDLLVGGLPCQNYSVAVTLDKSPGLDGDKGALWWEVARIARHHKPALILLENVDRIIRSPANARGRDFARILASLSELGYAAAWRVINASEYGYAQKRRRTFIVASRARQTAPEAVLERAFPSTAGDEENTVLPTDATDVSSFAFDFQNAGAMRGRIIRTWKARSIGAAPTPLRDVLEKSAPARYFIPPRDLAKWKYLKGAKDEPRTAQNGHAYRYKEGALPFPDPLDRPARTILTSEGGIAPSRLRHIIQPPGLRRYRCLTPVECERLQNFPDNWTSGAPERFRYYAMGNALVVGLVAQIGRSLQHEFAPAHVEVSA